MAVKRRRSRGAAKRTGEAERDVVSTVLDTTAMLVGVADCDGRVIYINRAFERLTGYRLEEMRGRPYWDMYPEADEAEGTRAFFANLPTDGKLIELENIWTMRDGQKRVIAWKTTVLMADGEATHVVGSGIDVTVRWQTENALRRSEERFTLAAAGSHQGLYDANVLTGEMYFSPYARSLLRLSDIESGNLFDEWCARIHSDDRGRIMAEVARHLAGPAPDFQVEYRLRYADGTCRDLLVSGLSMRDAAGWPYRMVGWITDVTERKHAEEELNKQALVLENMAEGVTVTDEDGIIRFTNPALDAMFGYQRDELIGQPLILLNVGMLSEGERMAAAIIQSIRREGKWSGEVISRKKDGTRFATRARVSALNLPGVEWLVCVQEDITERQRTEHALRESEERFRDLVENLNDVIYTVDDQHVLTYASPAIERLAGYRPSEAVGRHAEEFVHPEDWPVVLAAYHRAVEGHSQQFECRYVRADGGGGWVRVSTQSVFRDGQFVGLRCIASEITERKKAEEQARQHQANLAHVLRLRTMGEMASGLAHELNQPLAAIVNYARGCARRLSSGQRASSELLAALDQIAKEALRAGGIVRGLRQFVRKKAPQQTTADLNALLLETIHLVQPEARAEDVTITTHLTPGLPAVRVDRVQIEQVILNLLRNGIEALRGSNGTLRGLSIHSSIADARSCAVAISDTGTGLAPGIADKIFDSFFTTKPDGLGMGLSISRSIIEAHGGRLWATVNPGPGATFRFTLPVAR